MSKSPSLAASTSYHTSLAVTDESTVVEYFLEQLRPLAIRYHARYPMHEVEDYINIGILDILHVMRTKGRCDYPYLYGVARMAMVHASYDKSLDLSLDRWLYDPDTNMHRDIEDTSPAPGPVASRDMRIRINRILNSIGPKPRAVLLSYYGIQDRAGRIRRPEHVRQTYKLTKAQYSNVRTWIIHKLSVQLGREGWR